MEYGWIQKSKVILFQKSKSPTLTSGLKFKEEIIELVPSFKYLGVIFDKKMKFTNHIDNVAAKAQKGVDMLIQKLC